MKYSIVILSKNPVNCGRCVNAVCRMEPDLPRRNIIIVDDGAREMAEANCPGVTWLDGEKPFVFARNANIGLRYAFEQSDYAVLLNDDALITTRRGLTELCTTLRNHQQFGILSPACTHVGNRNQEYKGWGASIRPESRMLCFICVSISRRVWELAGELDEELSGYGFEDDAYSQMVRAAGFRLGVLDSVRVDHGTLKSTFRGDAYPREGFAHNQAIYEAKYK